MVDPDAIRAHLAAVYGEGLEVRSYQGADGQVLRVEPGDLERTRGFSLEFVIGWRTVSGRFVPGPFAQGIIDAMRRSGPEQRGQFAALAGIASGKGGVVNVEIGGNPVDPLSPDSWPRDRWEGFALSVRRIGLVLDPGDPAAAGAAVLPWITRAVGMALALLPVETTEQGVIAGEAEGASHAELVKRYERNRLNRALCIDYHGCRCAACELDFGDKYGPVGEGFIHVHHLEPVSMMKGSYKLDPARDLVPLCPNCHAMAHRRTPPFTPEEVGEMFRGA